jgi:arylsulfatase A-like enzyme/Flp pilus assembly protein TadD
MNTDVKRRVFLYIFIPLFAGTIFSDRSLSASQGKQKQLNVLLITLDTIRPDRLSCYSSEYLNTPNIEELSAGGALFERAFAHNPITLPSHANILLGTTPLYHGVHDNSKFWVAENFVTLAEFLKEKGYSTGAFIGAFALDSRFGLSQGFDVYDDTFPSGPSAAFVSPERKAEEVIRPALDWLKNQDSRWFAWIHLWDPHAPYLPPEPFKSQYKDDPYSGEVAYVDSELGNLLDYLKTKNLMDSTLIILTGDHGESLGEHGELTHTYFAYNSTLWIPLMFAGPGIEASRIEKNASHIDIFPTVCDILEIEKPSFLQGASLFPLIKGKKTEERAIYFESLGPYYNQGWAPLRGFIEGQKKFFDSPLPEFYNLEEDFNEAHNRIENIDLDSYLKKQKKIEEELSSSQKAPGNQRVDREAQEKLRSLGYVVSSAVQLKESYGPEDDLKTLLPWQQKLDQAAVLFDEGQVDKGIAQIDEILQQRKDLVPAYIYLSDIYKAQGRFDLANITLNEGLNNNPDNYALLSTYGIFLVRQGNWDKGIEVLGKALSLLDFDYELWNYLGYASMRKGEDKKALEFYNKSISLNDSDAQVYFNLGSLYLSQFMQSKDRNIHFQAMESFKRAIELDPKYSLAYRSLGIGYRIQGRTAEAIAVWETALELSPDDDFLVYNLGQAQFELGNKAQALLYFEKLLSLKKAMTPEERKDIEALILECKKNPEHPFDIEQTFLTC